MASLLAYHVPYTGRDFEELIEYTDEVLKNIFPTSHVGLNRFKFAETVVFVLRGPSYERQDEKAEIYFHPFDMIRWIYQQYRNGFMQKQASYLTRHRDIPIRTIMMLDSVIMGIWLGLTERLSPEIWNRVTLEFLGLVDANDEEVLIERAYSELQGYGDLMYKIINS